MVYQPAPSPTSQPPFAGDKAAILRECRALYLKELVQLLREGEALPPRALENFSDAVGAYFDEMVSTKRRSSFEEAKDLTASRISLVGETDLELDIRLGEFTARLQETTGGDLWRVYLRFMTLLDRPDMNAADNPVGPRGIAQGLTRLCADLAENHDTFLDRIERLENYLARNLTVLYAAINDLLARRNVGSAQPGIVTAADSPGSPASSTVGATANPAAALQKNLLGQSASAPSGDSGGTGNGGGGALASLFTQAMLERLLARLDDLDKKGPGAAAPRTVMTDSPSLETLIPGLFSAAAPQPVEAPAPKSLKAAELGIPSGAPEAATIDALALIFETIFKSATLPEAIKSALASLQIPTLKAAMLDTSFFTTESHPARRLLDRLARATIGLPTDVASTHPLCQTIQDIASRLRREFASDPQIFEHLLGEVESLIADRDAAIARAATDYLPLLHQADRHSKQADQCRKLIEDHCRRNIPPAIASFLREHWQKLLLAIAGEQGEQSDDWKKYTAVIDDLLWSVQPKAAIDDRKQLAKILPAMLQTLNDGMARLQLAPDSRKEFMDVCFALQTTALRGGSSDLPPPASAPAAESETMCQRDIEADGRLLKILDLAPTRTPLRLPPSKVGDWLTFIGPDSHPLCGRLCYVSPDSGQSLLLNPDWPHACSLHPLLLDRQLQEGKARICSGDSLFNSAAEEALQKTIPL